MGRAIGAGVYNSTKAARIAQLPVVPVTPAVQAVPEVPGGDPAVLEISAMTTARAAMAEQQAHPDQDYGAARIAWQLPEQQEVFDLLWWTLPQAAEAWGCCYRTARRWAITMSGRAKLVYVTRPRGASWRWVVPRGLVKGPDVIGNPRFRDPDYQRDMVNRRWRADDRRATAL